MTVDLIFDAGLATLVIALAAWTILTRKHFPAVVAFIAYGLLMTVVWVRLGSIDVALTEAAIGSGLTGALLIAAVTRMKDDKVAARPSAMVRIEAAALAAIVTASIAAGVLLLPEEAPTLAHAAAAGASATGMTNPVTNVLIAFRAMDTLLEKVVVLLALIGVWSLSTDAAWGGRPAPLSHPDPNGTLAFLSKMLAPVGVIIGVYCIWVSADHPGGAFQAGTILAAMWLLVLMAGLADAPLTGNRWQRGALIAGPAVFLLVALSGFWLAGAFLAYPVDYAKLLILAIEYAMTLTIAVTMCLLLAGPATRRPP